MSPPALMPFAYHQPSLPRRLHRGSPICQPRPNIARACCSMTSDMPPRRRFPAARCRHAMPDTAATREFGGWRFNRRVRLSAHSPSSLSAFTTLRLAFPAPMITSAGASLTPALSHRDSEIDALLAAIPPSYRESKLIIIAHSAAGPFDAPRPPSCLRRSRRGGLPTLSLPIVCHLCLTGATDEHERLGEKLPQAWLRRLAI